MKCSNAPPVCLWQASARGPTFHCGSSTNGKITPRWGETQMLNDPDETSGILKKLRHKGPRVKPHGPFNNTEHCVMMSHTARLDAPIWLHTWSCSAPLWIRRGSTAKPSSFPQSNLLVHTFNPPWEHSTFTLYTCDWFIPHLLPSWLSLTNISEKKNSSCQVNKSHEETQSNNTLMEVSVWCMCEMLPKPTFALGDALTHITLPTEQQMCTRVPTNCLLCSIFYFSKWNLHIFL